jgi:AcrR family transcriptional regulator
MPGHLQRFPAGRDAFQADLMSRDQRARILAAMAELTSKRGYQATTVELIVKRAGVARVTFYENFENREACLLALFDEAVAGASDLVQEAIADAGDWPSEVEAALRALLDLAVTKPALARTVIVETMTAGTAAMERYERALRLGRPLFRRGRELSADPGAIPETVEDSIIGGLVWTVHQRILRGEIERVPGLLPTMVQFALAPYLGEQRAAELAPAA